MNKVSEQLVILHDYFAIRGGGERLVLTLAEALKGTLVFGYRTGDTYEPAKFPSDYRDLGLPTLLRRSGIRPLALAARFRGARHTTDPFGIRIYSGVAAPFAAPPKSGRARNIYYCHTPPRFLFDQREHFLAQLPRALRILANQVLRRYEHGYLRAIERMDVILANSETTKARIARYLGRDSVIIHPPIDTGGFRWGPVQGYYLSTARLTPLKRVETVIDAFLALPDRRLVVASGGGELERLRARAGNAANINFTGWISDATLQRLIAGAIATIYVPRDEDFGMSPVESMSAGKPVIGVAEGGVAETVLDGETGLLLPPGFGPAELVNALHKLTPERALSMRQSCERRAGLFSREQFVGGMRHIIDRLRAEIAI